jgi:hypothetical protein
MIYTRLGSFFLRRCCEKVVILFVFSSFDGLLANEKSKDINDEPGDEPFERAQHSAKVDLRIIIHEKQEI